MTNEKLKERYFNIKGMFLEIKDLLQESEYDSIGLAICTGESFGMIQFDNFKMSFNENLQEINLSLYLKSQEVSSLNITKSYNFKFYFDEMCVDFEGKMEGGDN